MFKCEMKRLSGLKKRLYVGNGENEVVWAPGDESMDAIAGINLPSRQFFKLQHWGALQSPKSRHQGKQIISVCDSSAISGAVIAWYGASIYYWIIANGAANTNALSSMDKGKAKNRTPQKLAAHIQMWRIIYDIEIANFTISRIRNAPPDF